MKCGTCFYFDRITSTPGDGWCKRYPPVLVQVGLPQKHTTRKVASPVVGYEPELDEDDEDEAFIEEVTDCNRWVHPVTRINCWCGEWADAEESP